MAAGGWEYKLVSMGNPLEPDVEQRASAFGRLGWELVAIDAGVWVFKRPADPLDESAETAVEQAVPVTSVEILPVPATT
jgi:hypothetical protein